MKIWKKFYCDSIVLSSLHAADATVNDLFSLSLFLSFNLASPWRGHAYRLYYRNIGKFLWAGDNRSGTLQVKFLSCLFSSFLASPESVNAFCKSCENFTDIGRFIANYSFLVTLTICFLFSFRLFVTFFYRPLLDTAKFFKSKFKVL